MASTSKIVLDAIAGIYGVGDRFHCDGCRFAFAYATGGRVEIPGVLASWFSTENGLTARGSGALVVVVLLPARALDTAVHDVRVSSKIAPIRAAGLYARQGERLEEPPVALLVCSGGHPPLGCAAWRRIVLRAGPRREQSPP